MEFEIEPEDDEITEVETAAREKAAAGDEFAKGVVRCLQWLFYGEKEPFSPAASYEDEDEKEGDS